MNSEALPLGPAAGMRAGCDEAVGSGVPAAAGNPYLLDFEYMLNAVAYCRVEFIQGLPQDWTHLKINQAFERLTGLKGAEGKQASELVPGIHQKDPELLHAFGRIAMTGVPEQFEIQVRSVSKWFSVAAYRPQANHFVAVFEDITERKRAEARLTRSARVNRNLHQCLVALSRCQSFESALECLLDNALQITGLDSGAIYLVEGARAVLKHQRGFSPHFLRSATRPSLDLPFIKSALDRPGEMHELQDPFRMQLSAESSQESLSFRCMGLRCEGLSYGFLVLANCPLLEFDAQDLNLIPILALESESILLRIQSEQRLGSILASMAEGVVFQNFNGEIVDCNPTAERILGLPRAQILGRSFLDPCWKASKSDGSPFRPEEHPAIVSLRTSLPCHDVTMRLHRPDGSTRWINLNSQPMFKPGQERASAVVTSFTDITDRTTLNSQLTSLLESTRDAVAMIDNTHRYVLFNSAFHDEFKKIFGRELRIGDSLPQALATFPKDLDDALTLWNRALDGEDFTATQQFGDVEFERNWYELHFSPVRDRQGQVAGAVHILRNVTARKQVEEALYASQAFLNGIIEHSPNAMWVSDAQGNMIRMNQACRETLQIKDEEVIGKYNLLKDNLIESQGLMPLVKAVFDKGLPARFTTSYDTSAVHGLALSRTTRVELDVSISPICDAQGQVIHAVIQHNDITEHSRLEAQLRQSQKLEGIGHLAGGVAHEFNNILAAMMMLLDLVRMSVDNQETVAMLSQLNGLCIRAASLIKQLLAFSRQAVLNIQELDLVQLVDSQCKLLRPLFGERIRIVVSNNAAVPKVKGDRVMLEQVLMNLCLNARDAMPDGGAISIAIEEREVLGDGTDVGGKAVPGRYVSLSVSDEGYGMTPETLARLFEPFFSTKEVGKGTGLGLATAHGIVEQHQGWIDVDSTLGQGSRFRVNLPSVSIQRSISAGRADGVTTRDQQRTPRRNRATFLVAEDDPPLRMLAHAVLAREGYEVLEAGDGDEALRLWEAHRERIDVLFTDVVMPGSLSGIELAARVLREKPSVKVIITSGYNTEHAALGALPESSFVYLPKPCPVSSLMAVARNFCPVIPDVSDASLIPPPAPVG